LLYFFLLFSIVEGETEKTSASFIVALPETNQVKLPLQTISNPVTVAAMPPQTYTTNQHYFTQFPGKKLKRISNLQ